MINLTVEEVDKALDWLAGIQDGDEAGTTRLLYSPSWVEAQKQLKEKFEELGMTVEFDDVGNLFATIEGTEEPESIITTGSHVDTVVNGGRLDGQLGIMAGYLAVRELLKEGKPKKSLRVISMAEEEGSRFPYAFWGSHNIFGIQDEDAVKDATDNEGVKFVDAMKEAGFKFQEGELEFNDMDAFIELHIEQGNFLEQANDAVGVVNAIAGQKRFDVTLKGSANHAGTTLMEYRHDPVEAFSRIVTENIERANEIGSPLVLTFGRVDVKPNVVNVVPGEVSFSIDTRHTDQDALNEWAEELQNNIKRVAEEMELEVDIDLWMDEAPTPMDEEIVDTIASVSEDLDLDYQVMHSGAGHDAQIFAKYVPTAMIFVPSINGVSHNPAEHTETEDIIQGVQALAETLKRLAY